MSEFNQSNIRNMCCFYFFLFVWVCLLLFCYSISLPRVIYISSGPILSHINYIFLKISKFSVWDFHFILRVTQFNILQNMSNKALWVGLQSLAILEKVITNFSRSLSSTISHVQIL